MVRNQHQNRYYQGVVLPKLTVYFNSIHKKWYFVKKWTPKIAHEWTKKNCFSDRSTTTIEEDEFDDIMKKIRVDFSKEGCWIAEPNGSNEAPTY